MGNGNLLADLLTPASAVRGPEEQAENPRAQANVRRRPQRREKGRQEQLREEEQAEEQKEEQKEGYEIANHDLLSTGSGEPTHQLDHLA
jgi:hypothetical protein